MTNVIFVVRGLVLVRVFPVEGKETAGRRGLWFPRHTFCFRRGVPHNEGHRGGEEAARLPGGPLAVEPPLTNPGGVKTGRPLPGN